jgi:hypothetical protein
MQFQSEVSTHIIPQEVAHIIPRLRVSVSPLVWSSQSVWRYTDLATQVRQACGMADGRQRVDRVSYTKCAPVVRASLQRQRGVLADTWNTLATRVSTAVVRRAFGGDRSQSGWGRTCSPACS